MTNNTHPFKYNSKFVKNYNSRFTTVKISVVRVLSPTAHKVSAIRTTICNNIAKLFEV